ncbi:tyrosine-protein kinase BAZ1B isoform X2 [Hippopotamus amphibius kiboko]|uniref:tyrosine-protein kinase BAZ1B isoform X2 n=1 Tax=Hippopotamus amphibius kiboko TaxID=575201 RepID=UPI0025919A15|nr:tyrosine-protein kinase BAZ1B isoform X2 [Hippopotamus amphibius kiboko]
MAPLLGRKPFPLVKPLPGEEPLFTIAHTQEAFRTREEYEARLERYSERIWTCKSTGSSQLTHKEAWEEEQEVAELLKEEFPAWYEKLVLEMVHHNTASLEKLVDSAWLEIMTKYAVGEECDFEVGKEKMLKVRIVKIHPLEKVDEEATEKKSDGTCDSPSSDKENSSQIAHDHQKKEAIVKEDEGRRESINDRARRSPRKLPTSLKKGERKWAPPKFLPHKYDVKLQNEDKYMTLNPSTKRKNTGSPDRKPSKKSKTDNSSLSSPLNPKLWCHVHLKKSLNGSPLKVKNSKNSKSPEEHLEEVMKMMSPNKLHANFHIPKKGPPGKKSGKHSDKPLKAKGRSKGILNGQKSTGNSRSPKKGLKTPKTKMKQMTLLDMAKGTQKVTRAPRNSGGTPRSSSKPHKHLPPAALHLIAYYKENKDREDKKSALSCVISKTARLLSSEDRARLPEELRSIVQKRFELLEHKKRWASMSEEQRKEYLKKKREELKEKLKEKAKERREKEMLEKLEKQKRYEDQELTGKNLPAFKLVDTPEGLPNTLFGDVAMVVEFLSCYSGLLLPDAQYPITAVSLMEALSAEKGGFLYLNRVLVILLQTLLQDEIAEDYGELGMKLSEIPLTLHSVSELVRLCLRKSDIQEESEGSDTDDNKDSAPFEDNEVQDEFLEKLETSEFFELTSEEKLQILTALCHRILMTYSVQDHMETRQQMSAELWKERLAVLKEENDKKRAEKQKRKEMEARNKENGKEENGLGKADRKKEVVKFEPQVDMEAEDMISAVKSRRLLAIQAKKEREIQEREMKVKLEREAEEERIRKHKAAAEKAFQEGIAKAKLVMRRTPIGTDRNHNRYWLFSDEVPGLFIEKGWVHDSIDYRFSHHRKDHADSPDEDYCPRSKKANLGKNVSMNTQHGPATEIAVETTIPKQGQNLWFLCDSQKELDELLNCLHPQGIRESQLKERLEKRYQDIIHSIHLARKPNLGLKSCDGNQELLNFLRSDLIEVATRLQKGGLGYVEETSEFEARVISLEKLKDFGECVIALQASVIKKFLQGFMAPKQKRRKLQSEDSAKIEEVDEEKKMAEEAKVASALEKWKTAIREAQTFSRMHVLLGMLDACIKWDMSAENARCKVCRKKGEDDKLILCDECNKAFHLFCLRPALYEVPDGEWQCPACQPATARRNSRGRNYTEESASEDSEDDESDEEEEEEEDEEEEDYEVAGLRLRPRKTVRGKQGIIPSGARPGRRPGKKPHPTRRSRPKAAPVDEAEVDELVLQTKRSSRRQSLELQKCEEILYKIVKYRFSWPFREPVTRDEAEDYYDVITHPMDFQTMQNKCSCGSYRSVQEFLTDMKQVFTNAELYNCRGSHVLNCMVKTEQCLVALLHKHLPGHPYVRRKRKKFPDRLAEDEGDSEPEPAGQSRGRRQKK